MPKTDFDNTVSTFNSEIGVDKTKMVSIQNELKMLRTLDLSYFRGKSHFEQDYLIVFNISTSKQIYQIGS